FSSSGVDDAGSAVPSPEDRPIGPLFASGAGPPPPPPADTAVIEVIAIAAEAAAPAAAVVRRCAGEAPGRCAAAPPLVPRPPPAESSALRLRSCPANCVMGDAHATSATLTTAYVMTSSVTQKKN